MQRYYIVISDTLVASFLDVLFLLLAVVLSELLEKPRRNIDWVTEISTFTFFDRTPSVLYHFLLLFWSTPSCFRSDILAEWPLYRNIAMGVICTMTVWVNGWRYENLLQFNTGWDFYERDIILGFFLASVVLVIILHSLKGAAL